MAAGQTFRLEPPRLRTTEDADEERHVTWFELYFDLVFVAAFAELVAGLAHDPSAAVFARFAALVVAIAWAWTGFTMYANRFDTDDLPYRLAKAGAAGAVAALAIEIPHVMAGEGGTVVFAGCYAAARALLVALYVRARTHIRGAGRRLIDVFLGVFTFTTLMWIASAFTPEPYRFVLWGLALVIDIASPPSAWRSLPEAPVVVSHVTERYGTFFIVVLGESVVAVVTGVAGFEFRLASWVIAAACFVAALCLWWIYFDLADTSVIGRGTLGLIYLYAHFPMFAGVAAFGAGTKLAIVQVSGSGLESGARWAMAGGIAAFALAIAFVHLGAEWTSLRDRAFIGRLVLAAGLTALAAFGGGISPVMFALIVSVAVLGQLLLEAFTFPTGAASVVAPRPLAEEPGG